MNTRSLHVFRLRHAFGLAALTFTTACDAPAPEAVTTDTVVLVTTATVSLGTVRSHLRVTGIVTAAPGADLVVVAPQPARIAELTKAEGDRVHRGDLLVRFDIPGVLADAAKQHAEVGRAQARLRNARAAQTRAHELFDRGVASRKEGEDADREVADAQADLDGTQAAAASADALAGQNVVRATFDGVIARRLHNPGDHVDASTTDIILRVINPARLEVQASVPMADVGRIKLGAAAHIAGDAATPALRVASLPVAVDPSTTSVPVRLSMTARLDLPVGAPVSVDIDGEQHAGVVVVPASAIIRDGAEAAVFVAVADKAARRPVTLGLTDGTQVELTSGLRAGELVVIAGHTTLPDGATIAPQTTQATPATPAPQGTATAATPSS